MQCTDSLPIKFSEYDIISFVGPWYNTNAGLVSILPDSFIDAIHSIRITYKERRWERIIERKVCMMIINAYLQGNHQLHKGLVPGARGSTNG